MADEALVDIMTESDWMELGLLLVWDIDLYYRGILLPSYWDDMFLRRMIVLYKTWPQSQENI